jgi:hypothetical protein
MNTFASFQIPSRKVGISATVVLVIMFAFYNKSKDFQVESNSVQQTVCNLGKTIRLNYIEIHFNKISLPKFT